MTQPHAVIGSVEIPVADLARARRWYSDALGYGCVWSDSHHALLAIPESGASAKILLVQTNDTKRLFFNSSNTHVMHSVVDFETDNLELFHSRLSAFVPDLAPIPETANDWSPEGFGFSDSEGNRLAAFCHRKRT